MPYLFVITRDNALSFFVFTSSPERVASNVHLLYALMQESHSAEQLFAHAAVGGALRSQGVSEELPQRLVATAQHYLALLDTKVGAANGDTSNAAQVSPLFLFSIKCTLVKFLYLYFFRFIRP